MRLTPVEQDEGDEGDGDDDDERGQLGVVQEVVGAEELGQAQDGSPNLKDKFGRFQIWQRDGSLNQ